MPRILQDSVLVTKQEDQEFRRHNWSKMRLYYLLGDEISSGLLNRQEITVEPSTLWLSFAAHSARSRSLGRGKAVLHSSCSLLFYPEEAPLSVVDTEMFVKREKGEHTTQRKKSAPHGYKLWLFPTAKERQQT